MTMRSQTISDEAQAINEAVAAATAVQPTVHEPEAESSIAPTSFEVIDTGSILRVMPLEPAAYGVPDAPANFEEQVRNQVEEPPPEYQESVEQASMPELTSEPIEATYDELIDRFMADERPTFFHELRDRIKARDEEIAALQSKRDKETQVFWIVLNNLKGKNAKLLEIIKESSRMRRLYRLENQHMESLQEAYYLRAKLNALKNSLGLRGDSAENVQNDVADYHMLRAYEESPVVVTDTYEPIGDAEEAFKIAQCRPQNLISRMHHLRYTNALFHRDQAMCRQLIQTLRNLLSSHNIEVPVEVSNMSIMAFADSSLTENQFGVGDVTTNIDEWHNRFVRRAVNAHHVNDPPPFATPESMPQLPFEPVHPQRNRSPSPQDVAELWESAWPYYYDQDHAAAADYDRDREANARAEVEAMQQFERESGMLAEYPTSTSAFTTM